MQNFSISRNDINPNTQEVLETKIDSALGLQFELELGLGLGLGLGLELGLGFWLGLANYKL